MSNTTNQVQITGSTYDIKGYLSGAGGKYDGQTKSWTLDAAKWETLLDCYGRGRGSNKRDKARSAAFDGCVVVAVSS